MKKEEIYSYLKFVTNVCILDDFILEEFSIDEGYDLNEKFYKYLKKNRFLNKEQDLSFKLLIKEGELEEYELSQIIGIISKDYPSDIGQTDSGTYNLDQVYAILAGFFEEEKQVLDSLEEAISEYIGTSGLNWEYIKTFIPKEKMPSIEKQECSMELSSKSFDTVVDGIETMSEILDENCEAKDIELIKKILESMKAAVNNAE